MQHHSICSVWTRRTNPLSPTVPIRIVHGAGWLVLGRANIVKYATGKNVRILLARSRSKALFLVDSVDVVPSHDTSGVNFAEIN